MTYARYCPSATHNGRFDNPDVDAFVWNGPERGTEVRKRRGVDGLGLNFHIDPVP